MNSVTCSRGQFHHYLDIDHKACFHKDTVHKVMQLTDFQSKVQLTCGLLRISKLQVKMHCRWLHLSKVKLRREQRVTPNFRGEVCLLDEH